MPADESPRWHPLLAAVEPEPGVWLVLNAHRKPYGLVRIVRIPRTPSSPEMIRFKAEHYTGMLGYGTTLREAVERVHAENVKIENPRGVRAPAPTTQAEWLRDVQRPHDQYSLWTARICKRYGDILAE